jgi:hypothetical protein
MAQGMRLAYQCSPRYCLILYHLSLKGLCVNYTYAYQLGGCTLLFRLDLPNSTSDNYRLVKHYLIYKGWGGKPRGLNI